MELIRVLLAAHSPALRSRLQHEFAAAPDMAVVGEERSAADLLVAVGHTGAELVVVEMDERDPPGIASHLLAEYPHVKLLGVDGDVSRACLYELRLTRVPLPVGPSLLNRVRRALRESHAPWDEPA